MANIESYKQLKEAPTERIVQLFDQTAKKVSIQTLEFLRNELALRETEAINRKALALTEDMQKKTKWLFGLTIAISVLTLINVVAVIIQLYVSCGK